MDMRIGDEIEGSIEEGTDDLLDFHFTSKGREWKVVGKRFIIRENGKLIMEKKIPFYAHNLYALLDDVHALLQKDPEDDSDRHEDYNEEDDEDEEERPLVLICINTITGVAQDITIPEEPMLEDVYWSYSGFFVRSEHGNRIYEYKCGEARHVKCHTVPSLNWNDDVVEIRYDSYANRFIYNARCGPSVFIKAYNIATGTTDTLLVVDTNAYFYVDMAMRGYLVLKMNDDTIVYDNVTGEIYVFGDTLFCSPVMSPDGTILFWENDKKVNAFDTKTGELQELDIDIKMNNLFEISSDGKYIIYYEFDDSSDVEDAQQMKMRPFVVPLNHPIFSISHKSHWASLMSNGEFHINKKCHVPDYCLPRLPISVNGKVTSNSEFHANKPQSSSSVQTLREIREQLKGFADADIQKMVWYFELKKSDPDAQTEEELLSNYYNRMFRFMACEVGLL